mmetsp:Transcript_82781/g.232065  ORF Transcript_82781/g.232065 Transcript_82781/m.232065 type:complete len:239 (+) Transcript_82781:109-825(+)
MSTAAVAGTSAMATSFVPMRYVICATAFCADCVAVFACCTAYSAAWAAREEVNAAWRAHCAAASAISFGGDSSGSNSRASTWAAGGAPALPSADGARPRCGYTGAPAWVGHRCFGAAWVGHPCCGATPPALAGHPCCGAAPPAWVGHTRCGYGAAPPAGAAACHPCCGECGGGWWYGGTPKAGGPCGGAPAAWNATGAALEDAEGCRGHHSGLGVSPTTPQLPPPIAHQAGPAAGRGR